MKGRDNMKNKEIKKGMDIVFLLDRSGSMAGIESDTIGGYNSYIKENINKDVISFLMKGDLPKQEETQNQEPEIRTNGSFTI